MKSVLRSPNSTGSSPARTVHALIFDLDGVIADTVRAHDVGWLLVAEHLGVELSPEMLESFRGKRRGDILRAMLGRVLTDSEIESAMVVKEAHYDAFVAAMTDDHILPGVLPLLDEARARRLGLGVASSSMSARPVLDKLGLSERFDVIADGATVTRAKPYPDVFLWTAGALRAKPMHCVVFEDAEAGVRAAHDAGMRVVGVGNPALAGQADTVVADLAHITLDDLLRVV